MEFLIVGIAVLVLVVLTAAALLTRPARRRGRVGTGTVPGRPQPGVDYRPGVGDDAEVPRDTLRRTVETLDLPEAPPDGEPRTALVGEPPAAGAPPAAVVRPGTDAAAVGERPPPSGGRMVRLRGRLSRSQSTLGRGLLTLLSRDHLDDDAWEQIEDLLLTADMGVGPATELIAALKERVRVLGVRTADELRVLLRDELLAQIGTATDRSLVTGRQGDRPAVVLMVGVNGTGKTTTCGKLARSLVGDGQTVLLGAADTFRAAAADQLATWGERAGAVVVRGPEGGDPASVAFDAVKAGRDRGADTVLIDTAGRLHTKAGLMDELGKVKRVVEKQSPVDETLLVLDATTGQNGVVQAQVFTEAVTVTGVVLTKLDGTAKGGIVVAVQRMLGIPVKLVGLGEGPDDLAPFDPQTFVDALLDDSLSVDATG